MLRRLMFAVAGILGLTLLVTARNLEPDPRGFGTHEQLGLTPCTFHELTGHVCPLCGGTTAWTQLLRGELIKATNANLGGMLLCVAVVIGLGYCGWRCGDVGRWCSRRCGTCWC